MNLAFWHQASWLTWCGVGLAVIGLGLSFTRKIQAAMACIAFASTALGTDLLFMRLDVRHVIGASLLFGYALVILIVAFYTERKKHGKQSERQGQDDGVLPEGPGSQP